MDMELKELAKQIPPTRFAQLAEQHRLSSKQKARARKVLVDGVSIRDVAAQENVSEEAIRKVLRRLLGSVNEPTRLTAGHFEMAVQQMSRLSGRNRALARRILVDGESRTRVAADSGISLSTLDKAVERIKRLAIPDGWRVVTVALPEHCAQAVEGMEDGAYEDYLEEQKEKG